MPIAPVVLPQPAHAPRSSQPRSMVVTRTVTPISMVYSRRVDHHIWGSEMRVEELLARHGRRAGRPPCAARRHWRLEHPDASRAVIVPATPSDYRWHLNALADMRRVLPAGAETGAGGETAKATAGTTTEAAPRSCDRDGAGGDAVAAAASADRGRATGLAIAVVEALVIGGRRVRVPLAALATGLAEALRTRRGGGGHLGTRRGARARSSASGRPAIGIQALPDLWGRARPTVAGVTARTNARQSATATIRSRCRISQSGRCEGRTTRKIGWRSS